MKTAILNKEIMEQTKELNFQFPALWDEDCNYLKGHTTDIDAENFQFPALWDEDCNVPPSLELG